MPSFKTLLLASALATPAFAQQASVPDAAAASPDTVVITAVRTPTPIDHVASAVTIIDKAAIDASQQFTVADLIARTPGVTMSHSGGYGSQTSVFIRGADSAHTVVVIDGVKLNDPSSPGGAYDFGDLFVGDAARIEVLRGPQSTLWGSQAIGGVVHIVTALPTAPLQGNAEVEGGSRGTVSGRAAIGGASQAIRWELGANAFRTDGISAIAPEFGGQEKDGYRHVGTSGRIEADLTADISLDLRGYWSHGKVDLDETFGPPDSDDYQTSTNWTGYAGVNIALFDGRLKNRLAFSRNEIHRDIYDPSLGADDQTFHADGRTDHVEYQGSLAIVKNWDAIFGAEHERSRFSAISPQYQATPDAGRATIDSMYGQINGTLADHLTLTGGVRYDHHETYGGHALVSAGAVWSSGGTTIRASYGEGFKAPTLYQLYSEYGNLALRPERAHGWDAGIDQKLGSHIVVSATYFDRDTRNLVEFAGDPPRADRPYGYYQNVDKANAHGIELGAAAKFGDLSLNGNYSWIDARDRTPGATYGEPLIRRPHHTANADVGYQWAFGLVTSINLFRATHSLDVGDVVLAGYTLVGANAEMPIGHGLSLFGRVENIGNTHYETAYEYGTLGRSIYGGIRAKF